MNTTQFNQNQKKMKTARAAALLLIAALVLGACQTSGVPDTGTGSQPTAPAAATATTGAPKATAEPQPTDEPTATEAAAATEAATATAEPMQADTVSVSDQELAGTSVTIDSVTSSGPAWLVIHADAEGKPGPVLGYAQVEAGENSSVQIEIDVENATQTLHAMLHTDAGAAGQYEFPGEDVPVKMEGQMVSPAFELTGGLPPSMLVEEAVLEGSLVTVPQVFSEGPGWLVIHADADGKPGPVLGFAPLEDGFNLDVEVEVDAAQVTGTVHAMLHTDAGEAGKYEFPGEDAPVTVDGDPVMKPIALGQAGPAAPGENQVIIVSSAFTPQTLTVAAGTTVMWVNNDSLPHTVTADDGSFDSGTLNKGDSFEFTFDKAGTFAFHCNFHGGQGGVGMSGTIEVGGEASDDAGDEEDIDY